VGKAQRTKGASAERELAALLSDRLGTLVKRRLGAARDGGHDLDGGLMLDSVSIEVKRQEKPSLGPWWSQACDQAARAAKVPVLAYRASRCAWSFRVPLGWVHAGFSTSDTDMTVTMGIEEFCAVVREAMTVQEEPSKA